jgi:hypothetical protein
MLVPKTYAQNDIISFKLLSGEEIVAKLVSETSNAFEISKPLTAVMGQKGVGFFQAFLTAAPSSVELLKCNCIMHSKSVEEISKYYISTVSGIIR